MAPQQISPKAQRLLGFVHLRLERDRVAPTRREMAEYVGFADKKSLLPLLDELTAAGWRKDRDGHRADDWGGIYTRPTFPPFMTSAVLDSIPQMGGGAMGGGEAEGGIIYGGAAVCPIPLVVSAGGRYP